MDRSKYQNEVLDLFISYFTLGIHADITIKGVSISKLMYDNGTYCEHIGLRNRIKGHEFNYDEIDLFFAASGREQGYGKVSEIIYQAYLSTVKNSFKQPGGKDDYDNCFTMAYYLQNFENFYLLITEDNIVFQEEYVQHFLTSIHRSFINTELLFHLRHLEKYRKIIYDSLPKLVDEDKHNAKDVEILKRVFAPE